MANRTKTEHWALKTENRKKSHPSAGWDTKGFKFLNPGRPAGDFTRTPISGPDHDELPKTTIKKGGETT